MFVYLFDIDGTLADLSHRKHLIEQEPKDWRAFFAAAVDDKPIWHMVSLARTIIAGGGNIVYASGRSSEIREVTEEFLRGVGLPDSPLFMREAGDHRPDEVVKAGMLRSMVEMNLIPIMAFDDRTSVVSMWRDNDIPCAQVAQGDF